MLAAVSPPAAADPFKLSIEEAHKRFNDPDIARQAQELTQRALEAARNCDREAYRRIARQIEALGGGQFVREKVQPALAEYIRTRTREAYDRYKQLSDDSEGTRSLAGLMQSLEAHVFGHCAPGPGENPRTVGGRTYNSAETAAAVREQLRQANEAMKNCDRRAADAAVEALRRLSDALDRRADEIYESGGRTPEAQERARPFADDAHRISHRVGELYDEIERYFKERCRPPSDAPSPPGEPAPSVPPAAAPPGGPAPSPTSPATPGTASPGTPATPPGAPAPDPGRAGDLLFSDGQIAGEVRDLLARADAAARRCDGTAYRAVIDRIRNMAERALLQGAEDSGRLYGLAANLELEIGERFKHCAIPPPGVPPPFQPTVPGPPPRVQLDQAFRSPEAARQARAALEKAEAAVQNCTPEAYDEAIGELRRAAEREEQRARAIIRSAGETGAAIGEARAISEEAEKLRALADKLAREREARFQTRCPPGTPGAALPGTQPGTGYALDIRPGGTVTWTPQVPGGTIFTRFGDPTSAMPLAWSGSTLSGGGVRIDAKIPLGDPFGTRRDWIFTPRVHYGYAEAHASGAVAPRGPAGSTTTVGPFTGRSYLSPAPDGTTGLFYGATGQAVDIDSHTHQFGLDLLFATRLLQGQMHGWQYSVFAGGGLSYRFDWISHAIDERNLSFDGVWSRTELKTDDHFFSARFAGGVKVENGRWHGSLAAYVAPGVMVSSASARQWNACSICSPPNDSFMVTHERTKSGFGVRTGVEATVSYRLTRSIRIGAFAQFDYSSRQSVWRNPVKPQLGPPHLGVDDAMTAAFGVRIGIFIP
jgi:hypothetical protein